MTVEGTDKGFGKMLVQLDSIQRPHVLPALLKRVELGLLAPTYRCDLGARARLKIAPITRDGADLHHDRAGSPVQRRRSLPGSR
jgi:hypothetical protein